MWKYFFHKISHLREKGRSLVLAKPTYIEEFNQAIFSTFRVKATFPISSVVSVKDEGHSLLYLAGELKEIPLGQASKWYQKDSDLQELDYEKEVAKYRFSGLLMGLAHRGYATTEDDNLINSWVYSDGDFVGAWEPYTISERISNICAFCMLTNYLERVSEREKQNLSNRLVKEAKILFKNLEVYEEDLTSNHYLNNGRAFVWLGAFLGNKNIAKLGKKIILDKFKNLFPEGVLREGSVHYHLLLTKNIFEVVTLLKGLQSIAEDELKILNVEKLIQTSLELTSSHSIVPNVGDISPDCDISWIADVGLINPESNFFKPPSVPCRSWVDLFGVEKKSTYARSNQLVRNDEYAVLRKNGFELFVHRNPKGYSFLPSHSHCDSGSYFLSKEDNVVVWDKGRKSYDSEESVSAKSNSCLLVDGLGPDFRERGIFSNSFKDTYKHQLLKFEAQGESVFLDLKYRNGVIVKRKYSLGDMFTENVEVLGKGRSTLSLHLYVNDKAQVLSDISFRESEAIIFPSYGQELKVKKISFNTTQSLPFRFSYQVKI